MTPLADSVYEFDDFLLDPKQRVLRLRHEPVPLTPKAFEMLLVLVQSQGLLMTKDKLIKTVWADSFVEDSNLTQVVFVLRKALGETPDRRYVLTVQGQGYRFAADVRVVPRNGIPAEHVRLPGLEASATTESGSNPASETAPVEHWLDRKLWLIIAGALTAFLIAVAAGYLRWSGVGAPPQPPPGRVMLAVLPFQNLTGDAAQEYFSDGMTEEMITQLGNLDPQHLGVIARTTVMHYKTSQTPLSQVGRELGVQYVIEGSVRRDANNVRITAQLIQTKDQTHVWARQYDRELKGLLTLQGEIAQEIADELQLTLGDHSLVAAHSVPAPQNYEAYDLYLKGQYFFNKRTAPSLKEAIADFEQATTKDPSYARAYAGMANAYALLGAYSDLPETEFVPKARAAALRALQIDDSLSEAHTALALIVQNYDWDWQTAEKEFRRAIELNPNYPTAHQWYGEHLMWCSHFDEALQESERARQLDPLSLIIAADNGAILYFSRRYDRAIQKSCLEIRGVCAESLRCL